MRRVRLVLTAGSWPVASAAGWVTLGCDDRQRRRLAMADDAGEPFLLDLERAVVLQDGDGLLLDGGGVIGVRAAAEAVADLYAADAIGMARLAWHLGNRHTPIQLLADGAIRIRDDAVLVAMAGAQGACIVRHPAPFEPEAGAYAAGRHRHHGDTGGD